MRVRAPLALATCVALCCGAASAQQINEAELERILQEDIAPIIGDLDLLLLEGPKYLAKRLPAMQAAGDFGGQMDLNAPGDFSLGLGILGGVFFGFDDEVGSRFQRFPNKLPEPLPIPAGMITGRVALTENFELNARYGFFPDFEVKSQGYLIKGTTSLYGLRGRYRHSRAKGWKPAFITSAEYSYFTGFLNVGRDFSFSLTPIRSNEFNDTVNQAFGRQVIAPGEEVNWRGFFSGAPILGWDINQISFEGRLAWDVGWWHPYLGAGVDFAWGHVDSGTDLSLDARVSGPDGLVNAWEQEFGTRKILDIIPQQRQTLVTEDPRDVGGRLIVGTEFDLGSAVRFALGGQFDPISNSVIGGFTLRFASRTEYVEPEPPPPPPPKKPKAKKKKKGKKGKKGKKAGKKGKKAGKKSKRRGKRKGKKRRKRQKRSDP